MTYILMYPLFGVETTVIVVAPAVITVLGMVASEILLVLPLLAGLYIQI